MKVRFIKDYLLDYRTGDEVEISRERAGLLFAIRVAEPATGGNRDLSPVTGVETKSVDKPPKNRAIDASQKVK